MWNQILSMTDSPAHWAQGTEVVAASGFTDHDTH